ncbi:hypothetical protein [Aquimarina sp. SS2-1]|uniref:hypothetical protein n=1 Tax=Aquimarina besae TaxID=3342247 RepID=UPI00366BCDF1
MKNLFKIFLVVLTTTVFFSCEDDEKNKITDTVEAPWAYFQEITTPVIDVTNLDGSAYEAVIVAPFDNIASYAIRVNRNGGDFFPLRTVTEFPLNLSVTAADLATALGLTVPDLQPGDKFDFIATITDTNGVVFDGGDQTQFLGDISNPGLAQALNYTTFISCPFNAADAAGTYTITVDGFGTSVGDLTFEVVAGPGENQITMVNPFDHPNPDTGLQDYSVTIDVDPTTGVASIERQPAWHCDNFGCPYGEGRVNGGGFVFSCSGAIVVDLTHTVDLGSFGTFPFTAVKN